MSLRIYEGFKTLINMVLALISFFLVLRIILKFFSTNPQTPFVQWIFAVSDFLMAPFAGIVPNLSTQTGILDVVAIITLVVYLMAGYALLSLIQGLIESQIVEEEYPTVTHYHDISKKKKQIYDRTR